MGTDHSPYDRKMIERPNWRYHEKSKWKDNSKRGIMPAYHDFGRKTANGFRSIVAGEVLEPDGKISTPDAHHNPYINSHHDIGHRFRVRKSQAEISEKQFSTFTTRDVVMKNSTFVSKSIRSTESESFFNLALEKFKKLKNPRYKYQHQNSQIKLSRMDSDYNFDSPKKRNTEGGLEKYRMKINRSNSESFNKDLPIAIVPSARTDDTSD